MRRRASPARGNSHAVEKTLNGHVPQESCSVPDPESATPKTFDLGLAEGECNSPASLANSGRGGCTQEGSVHPGTPWRHGGSRNTTRSTCDKKLVRGPGRWRGVCLAKRDNTNYAGRQLRRCARSKTRRAGGRGRGRASNGRRGNGNGMCSRNRQIRSRTVRIRHVPDSRTSPRGQIRSQSVSPAQGRQVFETTKPEKPPRRQAAQCAHRTPRPPRQPQGLRGSTGEVGNVGVPRAHGAWGRMDELSCMITSMGSGRRS